MQKAHDLVTETDSFRKAPFAYFLTRLFSGWPFSDNLFALS
jgi:hypothetical protein